jgi:hypothetical protein
MRSSDMFCSTREGGSTGVSLPAAPSDSAADRAYMVRRDIDHHVYFLSWMRRILAACLFKHCRNSLARCSLRGLLRPSRHLRIDS